MAMTTSVGYQSYPVAPHPIQMGLIRPVYHVAVKEDEGGWFVARCIEIPAAITQGKSKDEALRRSFDAIGSILDLLGRGEAEFLVLPTEG
jgi:predicted RNase H-like HicB family nuclease